MNMTKMKVESLKHFWQMTFFGEMPHIRATASSLGSADELGSSQRRRLCAHVTLRTFSLRGCLMSIERSQVGIPQFIHSP